MGERGTPVSSSHGLPATHARASLPLVCQLPLDNTDLFPQSFGSTRLADAVLPRADLIKTHLQIMQLLFQR